MKSSSRFRGVARCWPPRPSSSSRRPERCRRRRAGAVVAPARPARDAGRLPAPGGRGRRALSLDQAIGLALANNQDLNVTVNAAEASQFLLSPNDGHLRSAAPGHERHAASHQDTPTSSELVRRADQRQAATATTTAIGVSQLDALGRHVLLGTTGGTTPRTNSHSPTSTPRSAAGLALPDAAAAAQLRPTVPTEVATSTSRANSRDAAYQTFIRSVQTVIDSVEQAYWDLVYACENLKVKLEAQAIADELNRITKIKIDVGSLAPIDIVQTEVDIATAEQDIINADGLDRRSPRTSSAAPQLRGPTNRTTQPHRSDRRPVRVEQQPFDLDSKACGPRSRSGPRSSPRTTPSTSNLLRYDYWYEPDPAAARTSSPATERTAWAARSSILQTGHDRRAVQLVGHGGSAALQSEDFKNWTVGLVVLVPDPEPQAPRAPAASPSTTSRRRRPT